MDIVFIGAIIAFAAITCAFAVGCAKLGGDTK
ncbi:MAG: potassium ABC transporter ATPase [Pseudomonadota bacterium]|nr:potassium ABC transporter ATPase [Pseudomonadota bacterium]